MSYRRNRHKVEELSDDIKNDLLLGFNLFKNSRGKKIYFILLIVIVCYKKIS